MAHIQSIQISHINISTSKTEQISVRVMRLWWKRSKSNPTDVEGVELILIDQNGDTIQATIKKNLVKIFGERLNEGETYKIRKFGTSSNRLGYDMPTYHQCKIWFEYSTMVVPCAIPDIPLCMHAFYSFRDIYIGAMPDKLYIDVIGRLEHVYPIRDDMTDKRRMTIILGNNENQQLSCTLFGSYIEQMLEIEQRFKGKNKPTLVFYFVKRSVDEGEVSISTTWGATRIVFNPEMNEVHEFNQGFEAADDSHKLLGGPESAAHHPPILASANVKSLAEIEKLTIGGSYVTMATFVELDTSGGWYYNSCKECRKKVQKGDDGLWYCVKETCPKKPCTFKGLGTQTTIPRFQVKFYVMNENHNLCEFIVWDDAMCELLGKTAQNILDEDEVYNHVPPPDFMPLIEKDFIVRIKVDKQFNIDQKSSKYGVISLCDNPRTVTKWQSMHASKKEQSMSIVSSSSKDTNKTDSIMDVMREMIENELMSDSQGTPQKQEEVVADASDKSSATKLQETKRGKAPINI